MMSLTIALVFRLRTQEVMCLLKSCIAVLMVDMLSEFNNVFKYLRTEALSTSSLSSLISVLESGRLSLALEIMKLKKLGIHQGKLT